MSWLKKVKDKLIKTSSALTNGVVNLFSSGKKIDLTTLQDFEEFLLLSDMGPEIASDFVNSLKNKRFQDILSTEDIKAFLQEEIINVLLPVEKTFDIKKHGKKPAVIMLCGVNGNGKTTSAGKLAMQLKIQGMSVMLGACDTFRAAAVEQLQQWGERVDCQVIVGDQDSDPASVGYRAFLAAKENDIDVLILDTAGRLHNKTDLMNELQKCVRVLKKIDQDAPHEIIMVVDSTTGQNAYNQIATFKNVVSITGLIFSKLDSSAKGGIIVGSAKKYGIPIYAIGVGESVDDLINFDAREFTKAIL